MRNDTSEENDNGIPNRKNAGSGADRLKPDFKVNTYETSTYNKYSMKVKGTTIQEVEVYMQETVGVMFTQMSKKGNKIVWREIGSSNDDFLKAIGKRSDNRETGGETC